jgi:hypothetical protein
MSIPVPLQQIHEEFNRTRKYRTIHSINDNEMLKIFAELGKIDPLNAVLDYGCHMGHMSIEIAMRYAITVFSVDNFIGTPGDSLMGGTINTMTEGSGDFKKVLEKNILECKSELIGNIVPMYADDFFTFCKSTTVVFDYAFIDSSHREEEAGEFTKLSTLIRKGGVLGGHDYYPESRGINQGVRMGIDLIKHEYHWYDKKFCWHMRKL